MFKRIAYTLPYDHYEPTPEGLRTIPAGFVYVVTPFYSENIPEETDSRNGLTNEQIHELVLRFDVPDDAEIIIEDFKAPEDRTFRDAWRLGIEGELTTDMNIAREVHLNRIREARDQKLKALDIETLKGIDVQSEKQILRDLTQTFDLSGATTPEELKAMWPSGLEI